MSFIKTGIAKSLLAVLMLQHGGLAVAMPVAGVQAGGNATTIMQTEHDCAGMPQHAAGDALQVVQDDHQHNHDDCVDAGCDDCVGCVACIPAQAVVQSSARPERPGDHLQTTLVPLGRLESLYRPPIC